MIEMYFKNWIKECFEGIDTYWFEDIEVLNYFLLNTGWNNIYKNLKGIALKINGSTRFIESIDINYIEIENIKSLSERSFSGDGAISLIGLDEALRMIFTVKSGKMINLYASDIETNYEVDIIENGKIIL